MANKRAYHNLVIDTATGVGVDGASITVYTAGTTTKVTIYSDADGTAESNPVTSDAYGRFVFYADPGLYDLKISGSEFTAYTLEDVTISPTYERQLVSDPTSGQYRVKGVRLDSGKQILVTYDGTAES